MLPTKFRIIWPSGYRREEFIKSANQKQKSTVATMFVNGSGQNEQSVQRAFHRCFLPSFSSFGRGVLEAYLSVIQFRVSIFKLRVISLSTIFFFLRKHTIINMNCLWRPCLLMDRDEISNLYRGPSIDASYQVSVHDMAKGFQRRRLKCEKLTDDR